MIPHKPFKFDQTLTRSINEFSIIWGSNHSIMDGSGLREGGGAMKPAILRVGVALVLSTTGFILARFVFRKKDNEVTSSASYPESSSSSSRRNELGGGGEEEIESIGHQQILSLKSKLEELQRKEYEMELRFERYCNLKDQEVMLMEYKSMLILQKSQLDFFRGEVSEMEEEHKRGQDLVMAYLKQVGEIQDLRSENELLEEKTKNLRKRTKQLYNVVNERNRRIIVVEKEFFMCLDKLERKNDVVKELESEVKDLKANVDVLQKEKEEVFRKFANSKSEMVSVEEYKRVLEENEGLKKGYANEVKEVINLRWSNACLRHEVMRNEISHGEIMLSPDGNLKELGLEDHEADEHHEEDQSNHNQEENHHHESSRRKRLMKKIKRWVEGNEKGKSTKIEESCFGRHSLTVEPEEERMFHSRRSCASV